ncbi:winged helix-turn-helix transcriptional regulator [Fluviibacterium sp. S390]|uniref:winged helix-turn-helix transcriptional regulator n=1 Tax=Fluviibacterium sp. S390 TaxID=3415139 RepID=UPI003C7DBCC5
MNICIVSQNPMLVKSIELMLADEAFGMSVARFDSTDTRALPVPGLVILDSHLPALEIQAFRAYQAAQLGNVPMLVIVGNEPDPKLPRGLEDADTLATPFHRDDLLARIHASQQIRRSHGKTVKVGALQLDLEAQQARFGDRPVPLTAKEYEVLEYLAVRKGTTLTKEMFLDRLYGGIDEPEVKIIDVFVCKIRRKLKQLTGGDPMIQTVWGRGYVLRDPVVDIDAMPRAVSAMV